MKTSIRILALLIAVSIQPGFSAFGQTPTAPQNLIENGDFKRVDRDGFPSRWDVSHPNYLARLEAEVEVIEEDEITFYRVVKHAPTAPNLGTQEIEIPSGTTALRISLRMRGQSIVSGDQPWAYPGISVTYRYDHTDAALPGSWALWPIIRVGTSNWQKYEATIPVRDNAPRASIAIISYGWTGTADFTDVVVEAVR